MAWKFVNSVSPKWRHWTLLLTDFFMKLFSTGYIEVIVKSCQEFFGFELPTTLLSKRIAKFESVYHNPRLLVY